MTSMTLAMGRGRGRSLQLGAVVGAAACLAVLLAFALASGSHSSSQPHADALAAQQLAIEDWESAVHTLILSGGETVALGPRTGVADLAQHRVSDVQMRTMAAGWVRTLTDLRKQIAAVATPAALGPAHELLDSAMAGYVTASRDLLAAAAANGARRTQLLSDAAAAGKAADHDYDLATAAIARLRAQLDLPTDWSAR